MQSNQGADHLVKIIDASQHHGDRLSDILNQVLNNNPKLIMSYHKNCMLRFTRKSNIPQKRLVDDLVPERRKLQRFVELFNFLTQCLYCAQMCDVNHHLKHLDR